MSIAILHKTNTNLVMNKKEINSLKYWAEESIQDKKEREEFLRYCENELDVKPADAVSYPDFEEYYYRGFK